MVPKKKKGVGQRKVTSISAKDIFGETLDQLLETAFRTLQEVREQVFSLAENARTEYDQLQQ